MTPPPEPEHADAADQGLDPRVRVAYLTFFIAVATGALATLDGEFLTVERSHLPIFVALSIGFMLSERMIFHVEARTEVVSYTPTELALAIGLLFLNPGELLIARLAGACVGMGIWRRQPIFKLTFNIAHFALETMVAVTIVRIVSPDQTWVLWISVFAALTVAMISGGVLVGAAISAFEGGFRAKARDQLTSAPIFYVPSALIAAAIAVPMTLDPWLGLPAATIVPTLWYVVRSHGALMHRFTDLSNAHDFSRIVGDAGNINQLASSAAERIADTTRAGRVAVRLWTGTDPIDATIGRGNNGPLALPSRSDPRWQPILSERRIHRVERSQLIELLGADDHVAELLVAPIADERGVLGVVMVADRQGVSSHFDEDDANRVETMIQQLAVAARKTQFQAQIQHQATHDRLTGLPNRSFFEAWVSDRLPESSGAFFLIDLDRFKQVNDAFGHHVGDQLLIEVAGRLRSVCTEGDLAARFGGDEYAVFVSDVEEAGADEFAGRLVAALDHPIELGPATLVCPPSIGIALAPQHGTDPTVLLRKADAAMYDAKSRQTRMCIYGTSLEKNDAAKLTLLHDLRTALREGQLDVHFQPQIDAATGRVVGAEALARWTHPEHGAISPVEFIGLAESAGLIGELTRAVLQRACAAAVGWKRRGWRVDLSVNISAQSIQDEMLEPMVADALRETGLDPRRLLLEITETTMTGDMVRTHRVLRQLEALGVRLSVDDFGTGHSSLVNLRHLPVSELKIDRSFVTDMLQQHHDDVIVRSTIDLAHNLGLRVVAEGVETAGVYARLRDLGCDVIQGFHISRPIPDNEFCTFVAATTAETSALPKAAAETHTLAPEQASPG